MIKLIICLCLTSAIYASLDQSSFMKQILFFTMDGKYRDTIKICDYNQARAITTSYIDVEEACIRDYQPIVSSSSSLKYNLTGVVNIHAWNRVESRMCTGWKLRTHSAQHWLAANGITYGREQFLPDKSECLKAAICHDCLEQRHYPQPCYNYWTSDTCTTEKVVIELKEEDAFVNSICQYRWKHSKDTKPEFTEGYWYFRTLRECAISPLNFTAVLVPGTDIGIVLESQAVIDFSSPMEVNGLNGYILVGNKTLLTQDSYKQFNFTGFNPVTEDYNSVYMSSVLNMTGDYLRYLDCRLTKVIQRMVESDSNYKDDLGPGQMVINKTKYTFPCASVGGFVTCAKDSHLLIVKTFVDNQYYYINSQAEITKERKLGSPTLRINSSHQLLCNNGDLFVTLRKKLTLYDEEGLMAYKPKLISSVDELNDWFSRLEANSKILQQNNNTKESDEIAAIEKKDGGFWSIFNTHPMIWIACGASILSLIMSCCMSMTTSARLKLIREQMKESSRIM